jgi:predicted nucleic acid-binding Zn finger protein
MVMRSSLIGKIEKAKRYAQERDRIKFIRFSVSFQGEHNNYSVEYQEGKWHCTCPFFSGHGICSHTMALEKVLEGMLPLSSTPEKA